MSWSFVAEQIARAMTRKTLRAEVAGAFVTSGWPTNRHDRVIRFQHHRVSLVVQPFQTALGATDNKNLGRKTHPAVCGVPTQSF